MTGQQRVLQAEVQYLFTLLIPIFNRNHIQPLQTLAGPQLRQGAVRILGLLQLKRPLLLTLPAHTGQADSRSIGGIAIFADHHNRSLRQHIGHSRRLHVVQLHALCLHAYVGQGRRGYIFTELSGFLRRIRSARHHECFRTTDPGDAFDQETIDGGAYAKGKQVVAVQLFIHQLKYPILRADIAIRHQHEIARRILIAFHCKRPLQRRVELGPSPSMPVIHHGFRQHNIFRCCRQRLWRKYI